MTNALAKKLAWCSVLYYKYSMLDGNDMIFKKNHKQIEIVNPRFHPSPKRGRRLDTDQPGLFRKELLVDQLAASVRIGSSDSRSSRRMA